MNNLDSNNLILPIEPDFEMQTEELHEVQEVIKAVHQHRVWFPIWITKEQGFRFFRKSYTLKNETVTPEILKKLKKEWARLKKFMLTEALARVEGYTLIVGIDEVGRGPLAGPVVAAACLIPADLFLISIYDSKKITKEHREQLYELIVNHSQIKFGVGIIHSDQIDQMNIYQATLAAMLAAVDQLDCSPDLILVDGVKLQHSTIPCRKIIDGDEKVHAIAAASIIAKVTRDRLMNEYHEMWPEYGFNHNKGYGTKEHLEALAKYGPCPIHRMSFDPLKIKTEAVEIAS